MIVDIILHLAIYHCCCARCTCSVGNEPLTGLALCFRSYICCFVINVAEFVARTVGVVVIILIISAAIFWAKRCYDEIKETSS
jgi:hypothetical protein